MNSIIHILINENGLNKIKRQDLHLSYSSLWTFLGLEEKYEKMIGKDGTILYINLGLYNIS